MTARNTSGSLSINTVDLQRVAIPAPHAPHFIGSWVADDTGFCTELIDFFEACPELHRAGASAGGVDTSIKHSTDLTLNPADLEAGSHAHVLGYISRLHAYYQDYLAQWPFLREILDAVHIGSFNIQKYSPGGHFASIHAERTSYRHLHRMFAWMTYLNDVGDGGETEFTHFGLKIRPRCGQTLIWPAEWTHAHSGLEVVSGYKYIITGWMHFPDNDESRG